jgi:NitT/TauT family transport system substrate-binding protein
MNISNPFAVFLQKTMPLTDVRIVPYSGSVAQFLQDPGFAQQGYLFSEPYLMTRQGGDPHSLLLADAGFNPYTSVVITTEQALTAHPELAQKFVQACAAGWRDYLAAPGPINAHIHQLNPQMDMQVLDYGAETLRPMACTSDTTRLGLGAMTPERWQALLEKMEQIGLVKPATVAPAQCFTARFVPGPGPQ